MKVYRTGERDPHRPSFFLFVAPAADVAAEDCPSEWKTADGKPLNIEVEFKFGCAEVPSNLGKYLIAQGLAHKSALIVANHAVAQAAHALGV